MLPIITRTGLAALCLLPLASGAATLSGFVRDHDAGHVFGGKIGQAAGHLGLEHSLSFSGFSLLE